MPLVQAMVLGERRPVGQRAAVHRRADLLRERHAGVPGAAAIDLGPEHQQPAAARG